jgi:rfaE bifunctional protein kinase chain/domain
MGKGITSKKKALEIIDRFTKAKVLIIGDIMVDHFIWGRVSRISPEAPVPVVDVQADNLLLGGCANVLNNIFTMGGQVHMAGVIGSDDMGARLLTKFNDMHFDAGGIIVEADRPTTLKTRIVAHGQQVVRFDRESRRPISEVSIGKIMDYIASIKDGLGAVVISDYCKGVISGTLLDEVRRLFHRTDVYVCVDPKQNDFGLYRDFDVITPNHHEARRALGMDQMNGDMVDQDHRIVDAVAELLDELNISALLMTRGEEGMTLFERDRGLQQTHFATEAKEVFDVTGAGDTVVGIFALSVASGATFKEAAYMANHAAGIVVGKVGTATVSQKELKKVL